MIDLHKLVPPENQKLFERFPELNLIWEVPALQDQARESYEEWGHAKESTGEIFTIKENDSVIGVIGWFEFNEAGPDIVRLRYYGIVPSRRGKGYAERAMSLFLEHLAHAVPTRYLWLSESVTLGRQMVPKIIAHFKKMGFQEFNDPDYGTNAGCGPTLSLRTRIPGR